MPTESAMLSTCLALAIDQFEATAGAVIAQPVTLSVVEDEDFWACVERGDTDVCLTISRAVPVRLRALWKESLADNGAGLAALTDDADGMTQLSIIWLILHELMHAQLGHFDIVGEVSIAEGAPRLDLVRRAAASAPHLHERALTLRCLELQADHLAIECLIESYDALTWDTVRLRAAAILAVMMVIETTQTGPDLVRTHPFAATRLFQLIGHLVELPTLAAWAIAQMSGAPLDPGHVPEEDEVARFGRELLFPVLEDAQYIALTAGARQAVADLSDLDGMFADLDTAKFAATLSPDDMAFPGAKEWATLYARNARLVAAYLTPNESTPSDDGG